MKMTRGEACRILQIDEDAEHTEIFIRSSYKAMALRWHPDKNPEDMKVEAEAKFKDISSAYKRLTTTEPDSDGELDSHMEDFADVFNYFNAFMNMHYGDSFSELNGGRGGGRGGASMSGFHGPNGNFGIFTTHVGTNFGGGSGYYQDGEFESDSEDEGTFFTKGGMRNQSSTFDSGSRPSGKQKPEVNWTFVEQQRLRQERDAAGERERAARKQEAAKEEAKALLRQQEWDSKRVQRRADREADREKRQSAEAGPTEPPVLSKRSVTGVPQPPRPVLKDRTDSSISLQLIKGADVPSWMVLSLEVRAAGAPHWEEVVVYTDDPLIKVQQLTAGTKYSFRSRIGREEPDGGISWGEYSTEAVYPSTGRAPPIYAASVPAATAAKAKQSKRKEPRGGGSNAPAPTPETAQAELMAQQAKEAEKDRALQTALAAVAADYDRHTRATQEAAAPVKPQPFAEPLEVAEGGASRGKTAQKRISTPKAAKVGSAPRQVSRPAPAASHPLGSFSTAVDDSGANGSCWGEGDWADVEQAVPAQAEQGASAAQWEVPPSVAGGRSTASGNNLYRSAPPQQQQQRSDGGYAPQRVGATAYGYGLPAAAPMGRRAPDVGSQRPANVPHGSARGAGSRLHVVRAPGMSQAQWELHQEDMQLQEALQLSLAMEQSRLEVEAAVDAADRAAAADAEAREAQHAAHALAAQSVAQAIPKHLPQPRRGGYAPEGIYRQGQQQGGAHPAAAGVAVHANGYGKEQYGEGLLLEVGVEEGSVESSHGVRQPYAVPLDYRRQPAPADESHGEAYREASAPSNGGVYETQPGATGASDWADIPVQQPIVQQVDHLAQQQEHRAQVQPQMSRYEQQPLYPATLERPPPFSYVPPPTAGGAYPGTSYVGNSLVPGGYAAAPAQAAQYGSYPVAAGYGYAAVEAAGQQQQQQLQTVGGHYEPAYGRAGPPGYVEPSPVYNTNQPYGYPYVPTQSVETGSGHAYSHAQAAALQRAPHSGPQYQQPASGGAAKAPRPRYNPHLFPLERK